MLLLPPPVPLAIYVVLRTLVRGIIVRLSAGGNRNRSPLLSRDGGSIAEDGQLVGDPIPHL